MAPPHHCGNAGRRDMNDATAIATAILLREALYLDEQRWDDWLALYHDEAEFWVPAWKSEHEPTEDPTREVSLLYTMARSELEDRVWRVRSGKSIASTPLPRTAHAVTNILAEPGSGTDVVNVQSICVTHIFNVKRREQQIAFARCRHHLVRVGGDWRIRRKKAILLNDTLPTMLDFYTI
jgi:3-phenylpropionate/cinnamic acid dioxygenase small subunit